MSSPSTNNMIAKVDRISRLPNALIHHIMSFIDTQDAVQTCVLSKRWTDIWKSLPFLNFDIDAYLSTKNALRQSNTINNFVDRVLFLREHCSSIQRFKVSWSFSYEADLSAVVNRWIDAAVNCNVQEVTIELTSLYWDLIYRVSPNLLNSKSLEQLTLRIVCEESGIHSADVVFPNSISLPKLKFMCLYGFLVYDGKSIERLVSSCAVLETLNIENCDIKTYPWNCDNQIRKLTVESLSLRQFAYESYGHRDTKLVLSAPNLEKFTRRSYFNQDYYLENGSDQLYDVNLDIKYSYLFENQQLEEKQVYVRRMAELLAGVNKVKRLELSHGFLEVLSSATDLANCQLRCLHNLQYLRLGAWLTTDTLRTIAYLLSISPNIKTLILIPNPNGVTRNYYHNWRSSERGLLQSNLVDNIGDDWEVGFSLPGMLSHLKVFKIENAEGCGAELKLLSFLLRIAKGLEEIALYPCSTGDSIPRLRKKYKDKLRAHRKSLSMHQNEVASNRKYPYVRIIKSAEPT